MAQGKNRQVNLKMEVRNRSGAERNRDERRGQEKVKAGSITHRQTEALVRVELGLRLKIAQR